MLISKNIFASTPLYVTAIIFELSTEGVPGTSLEPLVIEISPINTLKSDDVFSNFNPNKARVSPPNLRVLPDTLIDFSTQVSSSATTFEATSTDTSDVGLLSVDVVNFIVPVPDTTL